MGWGVSPTPWSPLPPGKTRYPLYRRLGGPQGRSGRAENLVTTGIRSRTVQFVVSRYTDWAARPTPVIYISINLKCDSHSTTNKMQRFTVYFSKTLYMFQTVFPSIIRSSKLHIQRQVFVRPILHYWSDKYLTLYVQFWAPDGGRKNRLKHVERLTEINKLWNVASCWLYSANILAMHGTMNVKIIATTGGPVRLFNLTRRNWISSLKIAQVRVVVEVGCYPTEARHVVTKDSRWEKTGSTTVHSVSSTRLTRTEWLLWYLHLYCENEVRMLNPSRIPQPHRSLPMDCGLPRYTPTFTPITQHQSIPSAEHSVW